MHSSTLARLLPLGLYRCATIYIPCRYAGFDCDYSRYPDAQQAAEFIRHYLAAGSEGSGAHMVSLPTFCWLCIPTGLL